MSRLLVVSFLQYRTYQLELRDSGGRECAVIIHPPARKGYPSAEGRLPGLGETGLRSYRRSFERRYGLAEECPVEIITGVERRRQWRDEEKLRILAELNQPGVKFSEVARRHDVSRGLLWQWRDAQRRGRLGRRRRPSCHCRSCRSWRRRSRPAGRIRRRVRALPIWTVSWTSGSRSCCRTVLRCASLRRSPRRPCAACWRRCAHDPDTVRRPGVARGRPLRHEERHAFPGAAGAAGARP